MNDPQTWTVVALVAGMMITLFLEVRGDRKELRGGLEAIRLEIGGFRESVRSELNGVRGEISGLRGELSEVKVLVGRMDERLKNLETQRS